jgi:CHAT domain-containing protein
MLEQLKRQRKVLHVASHYLLRSGGASGEGGGALLLGDGGTLTLAEIDEIPLRDFRLELVALSACDTALEGDDPAAAGAEVDSLAEVAQWRGAQAVLASLWEVADASTAALMRQFYQRRREFGDETKAAALQQAQLAMLQGRLSPSPPPDETPATGPGEPPPTPQDASAPTGAGRGAQVEGGQVGSGGWSHPFYWAPFVLIGNWR